MTTLPSTPCDPAAFIAGELMALLSGLYIAVEESNDEWSDAAMAQVKEWFVENELYEFVEQTREGLIRLGAERN